jgi:hypothetical protein
MTTNASMNSITKTATAEGDKHMNTRNLIRWAGGSTIVAGIFYVVVGLFHPPNIASAVTTPQWAIIHDIATAMTFFGLLGLTGLYARQVKESGWLGLAGYLLLSLWLLLIMGFTFTEVLILPVLATTAPTFVESWMGMFNGSAGPMNIGTLSTVWTLTAPLYMLGGLLFGIATIRAGILSRWAAGLLAVGTVLAPAAALLPLDLQPKMAVPVGIALVWLGFALWSERRAPAAAAASVPGKLSPQLLQTAAE